jgi:hypothetical protein
MVDGNVVGITVYVNGIATSVSCEIVQQQTACADSVNSASLDDGDTLFIEIGGTPGAGAAGTLMWSLTHSTP